MLLICIIVVWVVLTFFKPTALQQAQEMEREGLLDKAVEFYNEALVQTPENIQARFSLANILLKKKFMDAAKNELETILKTAGEKPFPFEIQVYRELAKIYGESFKKDSEYMALLKINSMDDSIVEVNLKLADYCISNKMFERAATYLSSVLEYESANSEALYKKGMVLIENGSFDEGLETIEAVIKMDSQFTEAYETLGYIYIKKDSNKSIKYFRIAKGLTQELVIRAGTSAMLGYLYSINKNWKKVLLEVESHLAFIKSFNVELASDIYFALGVGYYFTGSDEKAEEYWRELVKINFKFMDIYEVFQLKKHTREGDVKILDYWYEYYGAKTFRKLTEKLGTYNLPNIARIDAEFKTWLLARGTAESKSEEVTAVIRRKVNNHIELSQLPIAEFKAVMEEFVTKIGYSVETTLECKEGFDALLIKDMKSPPTFFVSRNWVGQIAEIPVKQMVADMSKMDYRKGIMVVCGDYTESSRQIAEENQIRLVGKDTLDRILKQMK